MSLIALNLNVVATTPKFSGRALRILASGWQVAPILFIRSAQEFTVYSGFDNALSGQGLQPPNLVSANPYPTNQSVTNWISKSAFAYIPGSPGAPLPPAYGNLGYNNLKGPDVFQLNLALSRNVPVWESRSIQLRAEAFNLPNHLNPTTPASTLTAPNFGQITNDISGNNGIGQGDYRVVQLAMKFVF